MKSLELPEQPQLILSSSGRLSISSTPKTDQTRISHYDDGQKIVVYRFIETPPNLKRYIIYSRSKDSGPRKFHSLTTHLPGPEGPVSINYYEKIQAANNLEENFDVVVTNHRRKYSKFSLEVITLAEAEEFFNNLRSFLPAD